MAPLICPVCGMNIAQGAAPSVEYKEFTYFFCSPACRHSFKQDPDAYINMQMQLIQERNAELELVRRETIACLSRASEYKDNETGKHTLRIAAYSQRLAMLAGLDVSHVELIRNTAPMHDVGKIGIPERILLKPGALDPDERKIMEQHPEIGARILGKHAQSRLMKVATTIAISHHEKWNGHGYPKGLKAEDIPIEGRIVAICDVFDALVSARPYKPAWPLAKIREFLIAQKAEHFDPEIARLFVQHFSNFQDINRHLRDRKLEKREKH